MVALFEVKVTVKAYIIKKKMAVASSELNILIVPHYPLWELWVTLPG